MIIYHSERNLDQRIKITDEWTDFFYQMSGLFVNAEGKREFILRIGSNVFFTY